MKNVKFIFLILMIALTSACTFKTVPPATKGKVLSPAGYSPEVLEPGKYTFGPFSRKQMILLQTNTNTYKEPVTIVLQDKLTLSADIKFRGRIQGTDKVINAMFNDITPGDDNTVSFNEVYRVYGQMAVRNVARQVISQYSVEDVHKNYSRLSGEITLALEKSLANSPLQISNVALGNIAYPEVVTAAINAAKERELAITKEQAQAEIELTKKKNERLLAEADYQIEITRAKAIRDKNKIIGEGVTPELLQLRALEVQAIMAENKAAVFMPYEAMQTLGAQNRIYSK